MWEYFIYKGGHVVWKNPLQKSSYTGGYYINPSTNKVNIYIFIFGDLYTWLGAKALIIVLIFIMHPPYI